MGEPWLLVETSGRGGRVGAAVGGEVVQRADLDPARRHNRDLAPTVTAVLKAAGVGFRDLHGVMVSVGPGSYTGLRVGIMSAKAVAFATGCRLVAVPTFHVIAEQATDANDVLVIADALQGQTYAQRFTRAAGGWTTGDLGIRPAAETLPTLAGETWVSGPGVETFAGLIPEGVHRPPPTGRLPGLDVLLQVGLGLPPLTREELFALEPLYLRDSSAEEKAKGK
ncbi:MAG: tRNA (adenosine(37)-N6)-threonylcarbamoyltransferase complex dimerization subunit type 1 TsaB [Gemmataceae bacterium]